MRINGSDVITGFTYPQVVRNAALSSGSTLIEILPTGTNTVAISATVTLTDDTDYTVSAIGDGTNQGLELFAQVDDSLRARGRNAKLRITHLAPFRQHAGRHGGHHQAGDVVAGLTNVPTRRRAATWSCPPVTEGDG
ncbi:MAG: DUF4397 domain-containing protein [Caldilineaceae bacterium]